MRFGFLQQGVLPHGTARARLLADTIKIGILCENLGFLRFWVAEHHGKSFYGITNPEICLAVLGTKTSTIRLGTGATLLAHHGWYRVARTFETLAGMFPGRIDLGIGRSIAPRSTSSLLRLNPDAAMLGFPDELIELLRELKRISWLQESSIQRVLQNECWLMASSEVGISAAQANDMPVALAYFLNPDICEIYRKLRSKPQNKNSLVIALHVIIVESDVDAHDSLRILRLWNCERVRGLPMTLPSLAEARRYVFSEHELSLTSGLSRRTLIGDAKSVFIEMQKIASELPDCEFMISSIPVSETSQQRTIEALTSLNRAVA